MGSSEEVILRWRAAIMQLMLSVGPHVDYVDIFNIYNSLTLLLFEEFRRRSVAAKLAALRAERDVPWIGAEEEQLPDVFGKIVHVRLERGSEVERRALDLLSGYRELVSKMTGHQGETPAARTAVEPTA